MEVNPTLNYIEIYGCIKLLPSLIICTFFPELFRSCTLGDLPKVQELIEEASATTINKLYQGGTTLLYK